MTPIATPGVLSGISPEVLRHPNFSPLFEEARALTRRFQNTFDPPHAKLQILRAWLEANYTKYSTANGVVQVPIVLAMIERIALRLEAQILQPGPVEPEPTPIRVPPDPAPRCYNCQRVAVAGFDWMGHTFCSRVCREVVKGEMN